VDVLLVEPRSWGENEGAGKARGW